MSIEVTTMVWRRLNVTGGELLLALAIADFSNKHGEGIWPSVKTLGVMSRQGERTVRRQLAFFRSMKWLEVIHEGGLAGGRGRTTQYRINPDWIKGAELAGFPDSVEGNYPDENPAKVAALSDKLGQPKQETLPNGAVNPATAMADNPSLPINDPKSAHARELRPSGSRADAQDGTPKSGGKVKLPAGPPEFDEQASRRYWWNLAVNYVLSAGSALDCWGFGLRSLDEIPGAARAFIEPVCADLTRGAVEEDRRAWPHAKREEPRIAERVRSRLTDELNRFKQGVAA